LVGDVGEIAARQRYDASAFVVIVTHDYKFELPILRTVLACEPAYIGLLAGRTRARALEGFLAADGVDAAAFARIHVPIGLDIGAQTAAEIALGILAQIVAVRTGRV
jgi:xanthine dehydrogenase accessory factor